MTSRLPDLWLRLKKNLAPRMRYALGWLRYHTGFVLYLTGRALAWLGRTVLHWWRTRHLRYALQGLPALVALAAIVAFFCTYQFSTAHTSVSHYLTVAENAAKAGDYKTAGLAWERLIALDGDSLERRYKLGRVLLADGQQLEAQGKEEGQAEGKRKVELGKGLQERGHVLIASAAPLDRLGHPPAHYFLAVQLLQKPTPTPEELLAIETHLLRTIQGEPEALQAHALLGRFYVFRGLAPKAIEHLQKASVVRRELTLVLASVCAQEGKAELAEFYARQALEYFSNATEENLDNPDMRLAWAEALKLLHEYDKAIDVLAQGGRFARLPVYQHALGSTYAHWSDQFPKDPGRQLELLDKGLAIAPNQPELLQRLINLTRIEKDGARARAALQNLLARGKGSAYLSLFLGVDAYQRGQFKEAEQYLQQAYDLDRDNLPAIANNLAWVMAHADRPNLPRALELVNTALKRQPQNPHFLETRGQIYRKMGQWQKARTDLLASLPALPDNPDLHQALSECYTRLEMPDMAAQHSQRAREIRNKRSNQTAP